MGNTLDIKNYGFVEPAITEDNWVLGGVGDLPGEVINPSGNWLPYLPEKEPQAMNGFDTNGCTVWATLNAIETLLAFKGIKVNYSDRYVYSVAVAKGVLDPNVGADPHALAEIIRTVSGNLREGRIPTTAPSKKEYYDLGELFETLLSEGQHWWDEWEFKHAYAWTYAEKLTREQKRERIEEALTKGTVCGSVVAWIENNGVYVKPEGSRDTHWTEIANPVYKVFDSYDTFVKELERLYDFGIAKVYYLVPAKPKTKSWWRRFLEALRAFFNNL